MSGEKQSILLMDSHAIIRKVAGDMIIYLGYEYTLAATGEEAVNLYAQAQKLKSFDAVIMDLIQPFSQRNNTDIAQLFKIDPKVKLIISTCFKSE